MATVDFESALSTLQSMFKGLERDVVAAVLEAHQGHMEATVETLLTMTHPENAKGLGPTNGIGPPTPSTEDVAITQGDGYLTSAARRTRSQSSGAHPLSEQTLQERQDAFIARRLQQEEFVENELNRRYVDSLAGPLPDDDYQEATVSGSLEDSLAEAKEKVQSFSTTAMQSISNFMANWGLMSRQHGATEYSAMSQADTDILSSSEAAAPAAASSTLSETTEAVRGAVLGAVAGISSALQGNKSLHQRRPEEKGLLSPDEEDGALASRGLVIDERRKLYNGWGEEGDEVEAEGLLRGEDKKDR